MSLWRHFDLSRMGFSKTPYISFYNWTMRLRHWTSQARQTRIVFQRFALIASTNVPFSLKVLLCLCVCASLCLSLSLALSIRLTLSILLQYHISKASRTSSFPYRLRLTCFTPIPTFYCTSCLDKSLLSYWDISFYLFIFLFFIKSETNTCSICIAPSILLPVSEI